MPSDIPDYLFDLIYSSRCIICNDEIVRSTVNRLLYMQSKELKHEGNNVTYPYIRGYCKSTFGINLPSDASISRHFHNHLEHYIQNQDDIPDTVMTEYTNRNMRNRNKFKTSDRSKEIERRLNAIENEEMKKSEAFRITGYNSQTGINNITGEKCEELNWHDWCEKYLTVEIMDELRGELKVVSMCNPLHVDDLLNLIDRYEGLLLLIARGHLKSTILQIYTIRNLCDYQKRFLYIGGSKDEVERYTENVRDQIKNNNDILLDYGYLPDSKRGDTKDALHLISTMGNSSNKDPHLNFASPPSGSKGVSKLGGHPDVIIMDDIQDETVSDSERIRSKHEDWLDRNILPMRKGKTKLIIAGTRKDYDDIYAYIKKKKFIPVLEKPAIIKFPNGTDYKLVTRYDGVKYWEGGQQDPIPDQEGHWEYVYDIQEETIGNTTITTEILNGVKGLIGGEVFWDEFRMSNWFIRSIHYKNPDGTWNKTLMSLQELLIEKQVLTADEKKGKFSFWSEFMLDPVETKNKHFNIKNIKQYEFRKWKKIVESDQIPKFTWIDVGYSSPDKKKHKNVKSGKTVMATLAFVDHNSQEVVGLDSSDDGVYILEIRSGNYFLQHSDPNKSLFHQILMVNELYNPQVIAFEDNYFGEYIRNNTEIISSDYELPITGKKNNLDKKVRISTGINARLSNIKRPLWVCQETMGYSLFMREIQDFPHGTKLDEIDAVESCDRLLVRTASKLVLLGDGGKLFGNKSDSFISHRSVFGRGLNGRVSSKYYRGIRRNF